MSNLRIARSLIALAALLLAALPAAAKDIATDQYFDSDGVKIRYVDQGVGDPIVLVHGFTASIENNWILNGVLPTLAQEFRVIALDTRGHGKSDKPHDPAAYGDAMVEDVVRLLDHLEIDKAYIVGYSMGGFITTRLSVLHPERVRAAVTGGAGWGQPPGSADTMLRLAESLESGKGIGPLIAALQPTSGAPMPADQAEAVNQMVMASNDPLALAAAIRGMATMQPSEDEIAGIEVPMMSVVGSLDPLKAGVDTMKQVLPGLEVVVIDGKDHMTAMMDPALTQAIRDFLVSQCGCA